MIDVTDEELGEAGMLEWDRCHGLSLAESLLRCHRAMRALEPVAPEPPPLPSGTGYLERLSRRLDALTALVLELARRHTGSPLGDEELCRLIAELEAAR